MFMRRYLQAAARIKVFPKHVIARVVFGVLMIVIGLSYARDPSGIISHFQIYGNNAPSLVAALYIFGGIFMIVLCKYDMAVYTAFPNFLYMGMALQLAINGDASWSGWWHTFGVSVIALIAIMRGQQPLVPPLELDTEATR